MKSNLLQFAATLALLVFMSSCGNIGKSKKTPISDGQVKGTEIGGKYIFPRPYGMVYIPAGTFHMGPSDEDISASFTSRNKQVSMNDFWMAASVLNYKKQFPDGSSSIDWVKAKTIKWNDPKMQEQLSALIITPDNRINGKKELDVRKLLYKSEVFDLREAAKRENANQPRGNFILRDSTAIYPDTLVWIRDFSYSYNEPYAKKYFSHPAYGNYPVVGVNWKQASAFCAWRTHYLNSFLESKGRIQESDFRLPTEAQWEYAARGGRSQVPYPWGGPYLRNKKGCLLANFKPGRGNYPEDGGLYTVRADAYWPNDFGLYNMAGNVAEWTSSLYYEGAYNFQHDMNPDIRYNALESDPPRMKRKVVRGGSWKDIGYFLQNGTRTYEYQDTAKSYIGFRCVIDLPPMAKK
ncbi:MAG: SUMF1/EgtB/PvdO family nonheme iron enzyme [Chitinophagaceae bacterium]